MAGIDWGEIADVVREAAVQELGSGQKATIKRMARGRYEPIPGATVNRGTNELATSADFDAVLASPREKRLMPGETTGEDSMQQLILSPGPFEPEEGDTAIFGGIEYLIRSVKTERPDGETAIIHTCDVVV